MVFANPRPISAHKSVRALYSGVELLAGDNTSTVKFLYKSVRKFFAKVSIPAKNSKRAANKGDEKSPFDFVQTIFENSSLRFRFLLTIPGGVSPSGKNR